MFFFVGGVDSGIRKVIQKSVGPCLRCSGSVDLVETAHTFKAFFVPVWSFSPKEMVHCSSCGFLSSLKDYSDIQALATRPDSPSEGSPCWWGVQESRDGPYPCAVHREPWQGNKGPPNLFPGPPGERSLRSRQRSAVRFGRPAPHPPTSGRL